MHTRISFEGGKVFLATMDRHQRTWKMESDWEVLESEN
jgi:hypothetical protein